MIPVIPSIAKYYGEQHSFYGGSLVWPSDGGFPILENYVNGGLNRRDIDSLILISIAKGGVFDLSKEEDKEYYFWVKDRIQNGLFACSHIEYHWDEKAKCPIIYMEWSQNYRIPNPVYMGMLESDGDRGDRFVLGGKT